MTASEVRKRVVLSPIALAVAIGVAVQTLPAVPWSPIESAQASHAQCSPGGGGGVVDSGGGFDGGCCNCSPCDGTGDGDGGGDGGK